MLERDIDDRLGAERAGGFGRCVGRLAKGAQEMRALVEDADVGGKRVARQSFGLPRHPVVAGAGREDPGFENVYLETLRVAAKRDASREVEPLGKDRDLEPRWDNDVLAVARVERYLLAGTE